MKRQSIVYNNHLIIVEHRAMNKYKLIVSNPKGKVVRWYNYNNINLGIEACKMYILNYLK